MADLKVFENDVVKEFRTAAIDGEAWFCLSDVCKALNIGNASDVKNRLIPKGIDSIETLTKGGKQKLIYINEANLYKVVFQSRKDEAERFTDWVTSVVLPSIRKHGGYIVGQEDMSQAEFMAKAFQMSQAILAERELRIAEQDRQIEIMTPKAEFFDAVTDSKDAISMDKVAKVLDMGVGRNKLFEFLRNKGILQKDNVPYQKYIDKGWFRTIEQKYVNGDSIRINIKTLVFQKGVDNIRRLLEEK